MIWQFPHTLWLVCLFLTVSFKEEFLILLMSILSICSFKHDILEIVPKRYFWLMWQIVTCAFFYNFHSLRFTFRSECLSKFCRQWERKTSVAGGKSHCSQLGLSFGQSSVFFWALLPWPWEVSCTDWVSAQLGAPPISSVLPLQHCLLSGFTLQSLAFTSQALRSTCFLRASTGLCLRIPSLHLLTQAPNHLISEQLHSLFFEILFCIVQLSDWRLIYFSLSWYKTSLFYISWGSLLCACSSFPYPDGRSPVIWQSSWWKEKE